MTEAELLQQIAFWAQVTALACCWIAGALGLKFAIYIKNHKDIW